MALTEELFNCVINGDAEAVRWLTSQAIARGFAADELLNQALIPAMTQVGCLAASSGQGVIPVHEQISGQVWLCESQEGNYKYLRVPEDVPPVAEAAQCLGGDADTVILVKRQSEIDIGDN